MTKSRGIGRGGKRENATGRPRKHPIEPIKQAAVALGASGKVDLEALVEKAYRTLGVVLDNPASALATAPVVSAARVIIMTAGAKEAETGKKGRQAEAAKAKNVGRFETPAAPRLVVDNR
jgi:hypothetical protein